MFVPLKSLKAMAQHGSMKLCTKKLTASSTKQQTGSALSAQRSSIEQTAAWYWEYEKRWFGESGYFAALHDDAAVGELPHRSPTSVYGTKLT
jgi:hypothetical protein